MKAHERLRWAIEHHGPGDRTPRAFQREVRGIAGKTPSSYYAITRYLEGGRLIPAALCEAAAKVMPPVSAEWLEHGTGPRLVSGGTVGGPETAPASGDAHAPDPTTPAGEDDGGEPGPEAGTSVTGSPPAGSPYADIYAVVTAAGEHPTSDHLEILDPKYPRNGLTVRDWSILYGIVSGAETVEEAAERVDLSEARVRAICDEQAEAVRNVSGVHG